MFRSTPILLLASFVLMCCSTVSGFMVVGGPPSSIRTTTTTNPSLQQQSALNMIDPIQTSLMLAETDPWVQPLSQVLDPFLNLLSFAMLCRVVISWYPTTNLNEPPFNLVAWPTEPLLRAIRGSIPPAFGVDITPIVWLGVFTFLHEILLGQQGLLTMKIKYGI